MQQLTRKTIKEIQTVINQLFFEDCISNVNMSIAKHNKVHEDYIYVYIHFDESIVECEAVHNKEEAIKFAKTIKEYVNQYKINRGR